MALRLTPATDSPEPAPHAAAAPDLAAALRAGDLAGYRELFAAAGEIDDVHARYGRRCELVEAGLVASRDVAAAGVPAVCLAVARELTRLLEQEPREPLLLNYAGIAFYELWELRAAAALFEAAQRLDPELANVADNLDEVARRRRVGAPPPSAVPKAVAVAARELGRRAARAAARAQPAEGLRLSLCMIVRDEEEMLPRCLAAAADVVDEIVVVDTGSSDRTVEIAQSFGARVIEHAWTGSFADARNVSFDAASGDWLMYLDADEVLVAADAPRLRELLGRTWREAFFLSEINYTGEIGDGTAVTHDALRIFRARPGYRFSGRLHEQIADTLPRTQAERFELTDIRIEHYGYLGVVRAAKDKSRRNIELLERQRGELEGDPFFHFNLGSEHGAVDDNERALAEFERGWQLLVDAGAQHQRGFVPTLARRLVRTLRVSGRAEDAIVRADEALAAFPDFTDLVYEQGLAAQGLGRLDEAAERFERAREMGDVVRGYTSVVGAGSYLPAIGLAEILVARGAPEQAVPLLEQTLAAHPEFFGLVLPYATALLAAGHAPDEVVARVEAHVELTPTFRWLVATALYEHGEVEAAELHYRLLVDEQSASAIARVALAEALLSQRRWDEAAATAAAVDGDDPHAPAARRSELFARLVGDDLDGAAAVLDGPLADEDRALFGAWHGRLSGDDGSDAALPSGSVALLASALEALLRVEEVDAFGALVPLLERCPLAERERRELLAAMYLRQGFLASAAEEWMAVCQRDPDAPALVGLARVAAAQGMEAEARDFAREARSLDPGDDRAARLLERLEPVAS